MTNPREKETSPGLRVRLVRLYLGIERADFCTRYDLNPYTLTSIELDRLKISENQMQKILEGFQQEGLLVTKEWILDGRGAAPSRDLETNNNVGEDYLVRWAARFFAQPRHTVVCVIANDAMEPFYTKGDLVGGYWHADPDALLGKRCIARINNRMNVGILLYNRDIYSLAPSNPRTYHSIHMVKNTDTFHAGEILWHVRHDAHKISELRLLDMTRETGPQNALGLGI